MLLKTVPVVNEDDREGIEEKRKDEKEKKEEKGNLICPSAFLK